MVAERPMFRCRALLLLSPSPRGGGRSAANPCRTPPSCQVSWRKRYSRGIPHPWPNSEALQGLFLEGKPLQSLTSHPPISWGWELGILPQALKCLGPPMSQNALFWCSSLTELSTSSRRIFLSPELSLCIQRGFQLLKCHPTSGFPPPPAEIFALSCVSSAAFQPSLELSSQT